MHFRCLLKPLGFVLAASLGIGAAGLERESLAGDEPGLFGRLFRGGNTPPRSGDSARKPATTPAPFGTTPATPSLLGSSPPPAVTPGTAPPMPAASLPALGAASNSGTSPNAAPRIRPQPRHPSASTEAEPILTRIALGRGDDGKQFGMFLQVFADGTVIDGEGVHRVGGDVMQPLLQALQSAELFRQHGHCGAPPTDFIEQVYVTVYQGRFGGVRSNTFSFTGNPQGCDPAVRQLHAAIETLVTKISPTTGPGTTPPAAAPPTLGAAPPVNSLAPSPTLSLNPTH